MPSRRRRQRCVAASSSMIAVCLWYLWACCAGISAAIASTNPSVRGAADDLPTQSDELPAESAEESSTTTSTLSRRSLELPMEGFFIIGGTTTEPNEFPAFAHMYYNDWPAGCGGSLIASKWVLTAAHCADDFVVNMNLDLPQFRVGSYCTDGDKNGPNCGARYTMTEVVQIYLHPKWDASKLIWDFALAELNVHVSERPFWIDNGVFYRMLDEGELDRVKSIGMGWINDNGVFADYLQQVNNLYLDEVACFARFRGGSNFDESVMCTNGLNYGNCRGDSGSPSLVWDPARGWTQVGVTSFGPASCENHNEPDGLARVSSAYDWIVSTICPSYEDAPVTSTIPDFCPSPPTLAPTIAKTASPVHNPTAKPTMPPSTTPTRRPTKLPTRRPSASPTKRPTVSPTAAPSVELTEAPTHRPTEPPTHLPTEPPTHLPTEAPWITHSPTKSPWMTHFPTEVPWMTHFPTNLPTAAPVEETIVTATNAPTTLKQFRKRQKKRRRKKKEKKKEKQRRRNTSPPTTAPLEAPPPSSYPPSSSVTLGPVHDPHFGFFNCKDKKRFEMELTKYQCQDIQTNADRSRFCTSESTALRDCPKACGTGCP